MYDKTENQKNREKVTEFLHKSPFKWGLGMKMKTVDARER